MFKDDQESNYLRRFTDDLMKQITNDQANIRKVTQELPGEINVMKKTLAEMNTHSQPDRTADYFEQRQEISDNTQSLVNVEQTMA